jgi:hypothetical protein
MIVNLQLIVLDQFKPSSLPHIEISLSEDVLEAFVIGIDIAMIPKKIMTPNL